MSIEKNRLLEADYLCCYFLDLIKDIEKESKEEVLNDEEFDNITDIIEEFSFDETLEVEAKKFFDEFFILVKEAAYILDPELIISKFEKSLESFNRLNSMIEDEELKEYIEDFGLTLENRLLAIKNEHRFFVEKLPACLDASVELMKEEYGTKIILNIQDTPAPLIGIDDLLNYQIKQITEVNTMIYKKLTETMKKYPDAELVIKTSEKISAETLNDFKAQIEEDKISLRAMQFQLELEPEDLELANDIAAEIATNLIYRVYWG